MSPFRPPLRAANYEPGVAAKTCSSLFIREHPPSPVRLRGLAVPGRLRTFVLLGALRRARILWSVSALIWAPSRFLNYCDLLLFQHWPSYRRYFARRRLL